jgi:fucose permease
MRVSFQAPLAGLGLLLAAWTASYFVASAMLGRLHRRVGTRLLLGAACGATTLGLIGLATARWWWVVPVVALLIGSGSGLVDAAVNAHFSLTRGVRSMGWLHASWALGAALGPQLVVASLAATDSWRWAFVPMALAFVGMAILIWRRAADWTPADSMARSDDPPLDARTPNYRRAVLFLTTIFLVGGGLEATAGDWSYSHLTAGRSVSAGAASWGASLFWVGLAVGRAGLGILGHRLSAVRLLDASIALCTLAAIGFWLAPPPVATFVALPLIGIGVSLVFPLLLFTTPARVGPQLTTQAVGYGLAAGTLGAGGLPAATGVALQSLGLSSLGPLLTLMAAGLALLHIASRRDLRAAG